MYNKNDESMHGGTTPYEFKAGDSGKTRDGRDYKVLLVDTDFVNPVIAKIYDSRFKAGVYLVHRNMTGATPHGSSASEGDLLPPTKTIYLNIYEDMIIRHDTEETARSLSRGGALVVAHPVEVPQG